MKIVCACFAFVVLVAPGVACAAPPSMYSAGVMLTTPDRIAALTDANAVTTTSTGSRQFMEYLFLETPETTNSGEQIAVFTYSKSINCTTRKIANNYVDYIDEDGNQITRKYVDFDGTPMTGNVDDPSSRNVVETSPEGRIVSAVCSGDWSKLTAMPVMSVSATRAKLFGP